MKLLLLFTLCLALSYAEHMTVQVHDTYWIVDGIIREKIKKIRDVLIENGLNNITLANKEINLNLEDQNLHANITVSGNVSGLVDFGVEVKSTLNPLKYKYELTWPDIDVNIEPYDVKGYISFIQLYGNGKLRLNIKNLSVSGYLYVTIFEEIRRLTTNIELGNDFNFEVTGWLNDEVRSEILSELVTNYVPVVMNQYATEINDKMAEILLNFIKQSSVQNL